MEEEGLFGGVQPAEGGLEVVGIEGGAACGGLVTGGSDVEEDAGAEAWEVIGIVGDDGTPFVELGVLDHGFMTLPVAQDLAIIDNLVVVFRGDIVHADGVFGDRDVGKAEV